MAPNRRISLILMLGLGAVAALLWFRQTPTQDHKSASDQSNPRSDTAGHRPNVLLILVDTLRADRLGTYGHDGGLSPTIDGIAVEGMVFERVISQAPWTQPSVASLFTSQYPSVHGVLDYRNAYSAVYGDQDVLPVLGDSVVTMAEVFQETGYDTAAFVANPFISAEFGFAQGFDHFDDSFASNTTPGGVVNSAFLNWATKRDDEKPFFALLHYMDVHGPYGGSPEVLEPILDRIESAASLQPLSREEQEALGYLARLPSQFNDLNRHQRLAMYREYWHARYGAGVAYLDSLLADLQSDLDEKGLWEDLFVVITSDHGEALAEHGHWDHGTSTHNPEIQVPLILRWKAGIDNQQRVAETVQIIDLLPTMSELLGLRGAEQFQGLPLRSTIVKKSSLRPAFAESTKESPQQKAVYSGTWKVLIEPETGRLELYDLKTDVLEQNDLSSKYPRIANELLGLWLSQEETNDRLRGEEPLELAPVSPELRERLEALGYVD